MCPPHPSQADSNSTALTSYIYISRSPLLTTSQYLYTADRSLILVVILFLKYIYSFVLHDFEGGVQLRFSPGQRAALGTVSTLFGPDCKDSDYIRLKNLKAIVRHDCHACEDRRIHRIGCRNTLSCQPGLCFHGCLQQRESLTPDVHFLVASNCNPVP